MDENDSHTSQEETKRQDHDDESLIVMSHKDPLKYQPYLESLTKSLKKREANLGRYNRATAKSYSAIGNVYIQIEDPRSVILHRACFRIHSFLYGECNGQISGLFKYALKKRGLTQTEIYDMRNKIFLSMRHEMQGDMLRRFGNRTAAVEEYKKAAKVEEFTFGRDNPDLAYLWRKIACLTSIKKGLLPSVNFVEADRLGNKWLRWARDEVISPAVCDTIRKGDRYYGALLYSDAVSEYFKVMETDCLEPSKPVVSKKNDHTHKDSTKLSKPVKGLSKELVSFLSSRRTVDPSDGEKTEPSTVPSKKNSNPLDTEKSKERQPTKRSTKSRDKIKREDSGSDSHEAPIKYFSMPSYIDQLEQSKSETSKMGKKKPKKWIKKKPSSMPSFPSFFSSQQKYRMKNAGNGPTSYHLLGSPPSTPNIDPANEVENFLKEALETQNIRLLQLPIEDMIAENEGKQATTGNQSDGSIVGPAIVSFPMTGDNVENTKASPKINYYSTMDNKLMESQTSQLSIIFED